MTQKKNDNRYNLICPFALEAHKKIASIDCSCVYTMCSQVVLIEDARANKHSSGGENVLCCIKVPNALLYSANLENCTSYIEAINSKIDGHAMTLRLSAERLEKRLSLKASTLSSEIRRSGRGREKLKSMFTRFDVCRNEVIAHDNEHSTATAK